MTEQQKPTGFLVPPAFAEQMNEQQLLIEKHAAVLPIPQQLVQDYGGMTDLIGKMLRGEIEFKPQPEPWHRCFWCWLVAKVSRHHWRCSHGWLESDCGVCRD